jgi:hypothetical protein
VGERIEVNSDHASAERQPLDDRRSATHEGVHDPIFRPREHFDDGVRDVRRKTSGIKVEIVRPAGCVLRGLECGLKASDIKAGGT